LFKEYSRNIVIEGVNCWDRETEMWGGAVLTIQNTPFKLYQRPSSLSLGPNMMKGVGVDCRKSGPIKGIVR
jgi:hypothetical protein